jgi:hypothetical protein
LTKISFFDYNNSIVNKKELIVSYYIISRGTGLIVSDGPNKTRAYKTFGAAQATRTRLCRKSGWELNTLDIVNTQVYQPRMVERTNIMTGKTFMEDVNTPYYCSPSSETFWST